MVKPEKDPMSLFFEQGTATIREAKAFMLDDADGPEGRAWIAYFDQHVGRRPWFLRRLLSEGTACTLPTQWPEWFDPEKYPADSRPEPPRPTRPQLSVVKDEDDPS